MNEPEARLLGSAFWRRTDIPMFEVCRLSETRGLHLFEGTVLTAIDDHPAELRYEVIASPSWKSLGTRVRIQRGHEQRTVELSVDGEGHWAINGTIHPEFDGLFDLDLAFSPATNTLAIRRLNLGIGESTDLTAVWLRFPQFNCSLLKQRYTRTSTDSYRYHNADGDFTAELTVDEHGLVVNYDKYWLRLQ